MKLPAILVVVSLFLNQCQNVGRKTLQFDRIYWLHMPRGGVFGLYLMLHL
jgi:hypothetical protein